MYDSADINLRINRIIQRKRYNNNTKKGNVYKTFKGLWYQGLKRKITNYFHCCYAMDKNIRKTT